MNFVTEISSRDVAICCSDMPKLAGLEHGKDYEIEPETFRVHWTLDLDARSWGIKGIGCVVSDIVGRFEVVYFDDNGDEKDREFIDFDYGAFKTAEVDFESDSWCVCPDFIDIDYQAKTVRVSL